MKEAGADNGLDTSQFVRGMHAKPKDGEDESDSAGLSDRGHASFLTLFTSSQGAPMIPYGGIFGGNQGGAGDKEWFTFNFHALIDFDADDGAPVDGDFQARIEGKRLERIIQHVRMGRRSTIKLTGQVDDVLKPEVTSINLFKLDI